jgi:hypothetical protein
MLRSLLSLLLFFWTSAALAEASLCASAASAVEASLRAYKPDLRERISIASALTQKPGAGLDFGRRCDAAAIAAFPLSAEQRRDLAQGTCLVYRSGGAKGLAMLASMQGTAHCHVPMVFTLASGEPASLPAPVPDDPFDLCGAGGVALGTLDGQAFYVQTGDEEMENGTLKIFPLKDGKLTEACTISASYELSHETIASFCADPALCRTFDARAAHWAAAGASEGRAEDPALKVANAGTPEPGSPALPLFGAQSADIARHAFAFGQSGAWFALTGNRSVDFVHAGSAEVPDGAPSLRAYTLIALYKNGQPAASFAVEKKRRALRSLSVRSAME